MDIFGKTSKKSSFQAELENKMKERKALGLGADLTETEDEDEAGSALGSDDDLLAAFNMTKKPAKPRPAPRIDNDVVRKSPEDVKPLATAKREKIPIRPRNELDRLLGDDDDELGGGLMKTKRIPWQPPQFKELDHSDEGSRKPTPKQRGQIVTGETIPSSSGQQTPNLGQRTPVSGQRSPVSGQRTPVSAADGFEDELLEMYNKQEEKPDRRRQRDSPVGSFRGTRSPLADKSQSGHDTPVNPQSPKPLDRHTAERKSPKFNPGSRQSPLVGGKASPAQQHSLDDIFGRKKSPTTAAGGTNPTLDDIFGRRKSPALKESDQDRSPPADELLRWKSPKAGSTLDPAASKKGSYLSSLLGEDDEPPAENYLTTSTKSSYLSNLLGEEKKPPSDKPPGVVKKGSYLDNLLADDPKEEKVNVADSRPSRTRVRPSDMNATTGNTGADNPEPERDSSVCRDVDQDPYLAEQKQKEREARREANKNRVLTENQRADVDIEEVAEAQSQHAMTYISPEQQQQPSAAPRKVKPTPVRPRTTVKSPQASPDTSTISFESASDIRNYIYQEWKERKTQKLKQQLAAKQEQEKAEHVKKRKEVQDKKLENEAAFRTWKESKADKLVQKARDQKRAEKKKEEEEKQKKEKRSEAEAVFHKWKGHKDEELKEKKTEELKAKIDKRSEEQARKDSKKKDNETAFIGWKKKKDQEIKKTVKVNRQLEKTQVDQKLVETRRKEIEAEQQYEQWLAKKEQQKRQERRSSKTRTSVTYDEHSPRPPWSPANKTIPYGR